MRDVIKWSVAVMLWLVSVADAEQPIIKSEAASLEWSQLPPLPDKYGFGGPIVGTHGNRLIVAGGANFPNGPPWPLDSQEPGKKVWHDRVFLLETGALQWKRSGRLPRPLAYAAVVSTAEGLVVLGGETFGSDPSADGPEQSNFPIADCLLIRWDEATGQLEVDTTAILPLPKPCSYHKAALIDKVIYVVASHAAGSDSRRLDVKAFWSLDLSIPKEERTWSELPTWPGAARHKMAFVAQLSGADDQYDSPKCLYLIGGSTWVNDSEGKADLSQFENFTDAYRYNPKTKQWKQIADLPAVPDDRKIDYTGHAFDADRKTWHPLLAGEKQPTYDLGEIYDSTPRPTVACPAIDVGQSHVLLLSGATGRYVTMNLSRCPLFPRDVLAYHTITDTWVRAGKMPQGVVTTAAVKWNGQIVIPSGEIRPGVRTPAVQSLRVRTPESDFGMLNYGVLGVYLATLVGMGIFFSRKEKGTSDFFLAGGRIPWWAAGMSIYATQLSAITFISAPAIPYASNWLIYPGQVTIFLMAPLVVAFYLPFFRRLNVVTAYEYLERRFSVSVRLFGSLSFIVFQLGRMAVVVYLPALALAAVTGMNIYACIVVMGSLATIYTVLGGMEAVVWTDVLQVIVLWGGMLMALAIMIADAGGVTPLFSAASADGKLTMVNWTWDTTQMATWLVVIGSFALQFGPYTTDQAVVQRYMSTKDEKAAGRAIWLNGLMTVPFGLLFFCLGTALYVYYKSHPAIVSIGMETDQVFPLFIANQLPVGLSGLVIAGVFAASMSSLDSSMHSVATAVTVDFYQRFNPQVSDRSCLKFARVLTVIVGAAGTGIALALATYEIGSLFFLFQKILGLISSGLVGIFILGIFTRRANSPGVLTGAMASFAVLYYVTNYTAVNFYLYAIIGISVSVVVGYVTSLLVPCDQGDLTDLTWSKAAATGHEK